MADTFRATIVFTAATAKAAKTTFDSMLRTAKGDAEKSRLTVAAMTWKPIADDDEPGNDEKE